MPAQTQINLGHTHRLSSAEISLDDALVQAYDMFTAIPGAREAVFHLISDCLVVMAGDSGRLAVTEVINLMKNVRQAFSDGDFSILTQPRGLRVDKIVDVQEFVESKFYMNQKGYVRPRVMETLYDLFHGKDNANKVEVVLGGAIGWGKSYFSEMGIAYSLYMLSCYHTPQLEFGLAPGSSMYFIFQSIRLDQAKKVLFQQFGERLKNSKYFHRYFPFDPKVSSEMRFPGQITVMPISSADTAALGLNVFGGVLDELNFLAKVANSTRAHGIDQEYDQAEKLYTTIVRRMRSRFNVHGRLPGKVFLVSSANYPDDFIDKKRKEAEEAAHEGRPTSIYFVSMSQWDALPADRLSDERFFVEVGDATRRSRIIQTENDAVDPSAVITVPMDYYEDFRRDLEAALRDLAGIPIGGSNNFIKQREKIVDAVNRHVAAFEGKSLFVHQAVELSQYIGRLSSVIDWDYLNLIDPNEEYVAHADLSLTSDSCGLAVSSCGGMKAVGRSFIWDEDLKKFAESPPGQAPILITNGALEIVPPLTDEIDSNLIGDLLELLAARINLTTVTADSFQSAALLSRMRKVRNCKGRRIKAMVLSVDTSLAPYAEVKQSLRDDRAYYPDHKKLQAELRDLQLDEKKLHVDHPPAGSKDVADAMTGSNYTIALKNKGVRNSRPRDADQKVSTKRQRSRPRLF
jgi:hypothetical protein